MNYETSYPNETNPVCDTDKLTWEEIHGEQVYWNDKRLVEITRLRLVADGRNDPWGLSYCYGRLADGTRCVVQVPFMQLGRRTYKGELIALAKADGVYLKGLKVFDNISLLW